MKQAIINLLKVKTILSLLFSLTTCYLAIKGKISMETFVALTASIITYYFNKSKDKESEKNEWRIKRNNWGRTRTIKK